MSRRDLCAAASPEVVGSATPLTSSQERKTPTMTYEKPRSDVAVFIDFENVYVSVRDKLDANPNFEAIMDRCNELGRVVLARAYADWYRYPRVTSALYANTIDPIYVATYFYDKDAGRTGRAIKNSVDMHLCIDAMKTLYVNTNIAKFVLVTGDRDFIPLVNSIRQLGKEVIVVGIGGAASTHLAQSADEFIFYEELIGRIPAHPNRGRQPAVSLPERAMDLPIEGLEILDPVVMPLPTPRAPIAPAIPAAATPAAATPVPNVADTDIYKVLVEAIQLVRKRGYVSTLGSIKLVMKELLNGDFKESRYKDLNGRPFVKFKDFVVDAEKRSKVQIFTNGTVNEVFLPGEDPYKLSQFAADLERPSEEPPVVDLVGTNGKEPDAAVVVAEAASAPAANGRRRRRRSRGGRGSSSGHQASEGGLEAGESDEAIEGDETTERTELPELAEPMSEAEADELFALAALEDAAEIVTLSEEQFAEDLAAALLPDEISAAVDAMLAANYEPHEIIYAEITPELVAESEPVVEEPEPELVAEPVVEPEPELEAEPVVEPEQTIEAVEAVVEPEPTIEAVEAVVEPEPTIEAVEAVVEPVVEPALVAEAVEPVELGDDEDGPIEDIAFADNEWALFRTMMSGFPKPASFQQIFDTLRGLRKDQQLTRTNEQLRTMVKQAINVGLLERSGRGKRVYYQLKAEE